MTKNFFDDNEEPLTPTAINKFQTFKSNSKPEIEKLKKLMIIIIPLLLVIIAGTYFFFQIIKKPKIYRDIDDNIISDSSIKSDKIIPHYYIDLEQIIVNLSPSGSGNNYLKLTLTLQFSSDNDIKVTQEKLPIIVDSFQGFLRTLRITDLNGTGSVLQLKEELIKRANKISYPIIVKDILFREILVN